MATLVITPQRFGHATVEKRTRAGYGHLEVGRLRDCVTRPPRHPESIYINVDGIALARNVAK